MKTLIKSFLLILFFLDYYSSYAQIVGVIYDKPEADQKYGTVIDSVFLRSTLLDSLTMKSGTYLMFNISEGNLYILGTGRKPLYPEGISVNPDEVFNVVSSSKVNELLDKGRNSQTYFEKRMDIFSITNGNYTLEEIAYCPPFCN